MLLKMEKRSVWSVVVCVRVSTPPEQKSGERAGRQEMERRGDGRLEGWRCLKESGRDAELEHKTTASQIYRAKMLNSLVLLVSLYPSVTSASA